MSVCMLLLFQVSLFAAETWSDANVIQLSSKDGWKRTTTNGVYIVNTKTTDSTKVDVYSVALTMWNNPSFRMVHSNNEARCSAFTIANPGRIKSNNSNTGTAGYNYYASLKPALLQTKTDTAKIQFKSY